MSRVVQTELFEGAVADAASFNATLTSWNAATAAGQISSDNVTEEGLDLRVFSLGAIKKTFAATDRFAAGALDFFTAFNTSSAVFVPVVIGSTATVGPFNMSFSNRQLRVRASLLIRMSLLDAAQIGSVRLAQSSDNVTFVGLPFTQREFMRRNTLTPYNAASIEQSCTISTVVSSVSVTTYLRLEARVAGGINFQVVNVAMYGEVFNK